MENIKAKELYQRFIDQKRVLEITLKTAGKRYIVLTSFDDYFIYGYNDRKPAVKMQIAMTEIELIVSSDPTEKESGNTISLGEINDKEFKRHEVQHD